MALAHATRLQLAVEGLAQVNDLTEFDNDSLKQITENLRKPGGTVPDPNPNAAEGAVIPTPAFVFGAKSQARLKVAIQAAKYYDTVGRELTAANMAWDPVLKNFAEHWKALSDRKDDDAPDTPKITKALPIIKWTEAFADFTQRVIGVRTIPLSYVIRETVAVNADAPALMNRQPYSATHGSVEGELIARASHTHPLFREDNAAVYYYLEEATRGTSYSASIKPFQRRKDGRGAWTALKSQYAGNDKWEAEIKRQDELLHTHKWKGQSNFSLDRFIAQHRNAFVLMQQCAEHVDYQLPNEHSRVGYLLDAIESTDPSLQAAMALVRNDTGADGKRNNFEATASYLLPHDPVARKRTAKRPHGDVTTADVSAVDSPGIKSGIGKTGVPLRFHTYKEYQQLTSDQKVELKEWREQQGTSRPKGDKRKSGKLDKKRVSFEQGNSNKKFKKLISEAIASEMSARKQASEEEEVKRENQAAGAYLLSLVQAATKTPTAAAAATTNASAANLQPAVSIQSILKKAINRQD